MSDLRDAANKTVCKLGWLAAIATSDYAKYAYLGHTPEATIAKLEVASAGMEATVKAWNEALAANGDEKLERDFDRLMAKTNRLTDVFEKLGTSSVEHCRFIREYRHESLVLFGAHFGLEGFESGLEEETSVTVDSYPDYESCVVMSDSLEIQRLSEPSENDGEESGPNSVAVWKAGEIVIDETAEALTLSAAIKECMTSK